MAFLLHSPRKNYVSVRSIGVFSHSLALDNIKIKRLKLRRKQTTFQHVVYSMCVNNEGIQTLREKWNEKSPRMPWTNVIPSKHVIVLLFARLILFWCFMFAVIHCNCCCSSVFALEISLSWVFVAMLSYCRLHCASTTYYVNNLRLSVSMCYSHLKIEKQHEQKHARDHIQRKKFMN